MKKYEYKTLYLMNDKEPNEKINLYSREGWRVLDISFSDGGNIQTVVMEKELFDLDEATKKALEEYQKS